MKLFKFSLPFIIVVSILIIEGLFISANGLDDLSRPYAYTPRDTIKAYKLDTNETRLYVGYNKLNDTLDLKFIRYSRMKDSTFDTVKAKYVKVTDSISSVLGRFSGKVNADSLTSAKGVYCTKINTGLGNYEIGQDVHTNSDVIFDSVAARITKLSYGIIDTTLTADSVHTRVLSTDSSITTAKTLNADSVFSTKGIKATNGQFSSTVNADSLFSTKGIKSGAGVYGTKGVFSSLVSTDSVAIGNGLSYNGSTIGAIVALPKSGFTGWDTSKTTFNSYSLKQIGGTFYIFDIQGKGNGASHYYTDGASLATDHQSTCFVDTGNSISEVLKIQKTASNANIGFTKLNGSGLDRNPADSILNVHGQIFIRNE